MSRRAYAYVGAAILLWGSVAAVAKLLLQTLPNGHVLFWTALFATLALSVIVVSTGKWSVIGSYTPRDYAILFGMGALGVFAYSALLFAALQRASAQGAFVVNYTWPLWVVIFAIPLLGERMSWPKAIGLLLGFAGVVAVASKGLSFSTDENLGYVFALGAAACYGLFSALDKRLEYEKYTATLCYMGAATVCAFLLTIVTTPLRPLTGMELLGLLWLGAFTTGIAYVCWFLALKYGDTAQMSGAIFLTPFVALVWIWALLREAILFSSIVGLLLILGGIIVQSRSRRPRRRKV